MPHASRGMTPSDHDGAQHTARVMMKTQPSRRCDDAPRAQSTPSLLRRIADLFAAQGSRSRNPAPQRLPGVPPTPIPAMPTPAELEALRWTMDGLTDREIGVKLGLPEREVALRVQRVMSKFGCGTRYEAGLRAIKLRLIEGI